MELTAFTFVLGISFAWILTITFKGFSNFRDGIKSEIRSYNASQGYDQSVELSELLKAYLGIKINSAVEKFAERNNVSLEVYIKNLRKELGYFNTYNLFLIVHLSTIIWSVIGLLNIVDSLPFPTPSYLLILVLLLFADVGIFTLNWSS